MTSGRKGSVKTEGFVEGDAFGIEDAVDMICDV